MVFVMYAKVDSPNVCCRIVETINIINEEFAARLQGDERQLLDRLVVSSNRLSSYIDNILNVARYDRHHLKVYLLEDTVANIYASIADDMQLRASTQHRMLNVNIPDDLPTVAAAHGHAPSFELIRPELERAAARRAEAGRKALHLRGGDGGRAVRPLARHV